MPPPSLPNLAPSSGAKQKPPKSINLARARAWNLPPHQFITPLADPLEDLNLTRPAHIRAFAIMAHLPQVRLVVVDSLRGANSKAETSSATIAVVRMLVTLARLLDKPILLIHHLRKRAPSDNHIGIGTERLRGSSSIIQFARLIWALDAPDPARLEVKRLQVIKSNLGSLPPPIGLTITPSSLNFVPAPHPPVEEPLIEQAMIMLQDLLQNGPLPALQVEARCLQAGISARTLRRARRDLGVLTQKTKTCWQRNLPSHESGQEGHPHHS